MSLVASHALRDLLPESLAARITIDASGCWVFTGKWNSANGYSKVRWKGRAWVVHRLVWSLLIGAITNGRQLDHLCRRRACCSPLHLEPVTPAENTRRGEAVLFRPVRTENEHSSV